MSSEALCPGRQRGQGEDGDPRAVNGDCVEGPLGQGLCACTTPAALGPGTKVRLCGAVRQAETAPQFQANRALLTPATSKVMAKPGECRSQPGTEFPNSEKNIAIQTIKGTQNMCTPVQTWTVSRASGGAFRGSATKCRAEKLPVIQMCETDGGWSFQSFPPCVWDIPWHEVALDSLMLSIEHSLRCLASFFFAPPSF